MENGIPLEIERKYLIRLPEEGMLDWMADGRDWITQTYLLGEAGTTERVRTRRSPGGETRYYHTVKRPVSGMTQQEQEELITEAEYVSLLQRRDPARRTIEKTRWCIPMGGLTLEIDRFPFWTDRALAEVELPAEDTPVTLPEWVSCIREVTGEKRYRNRALAREVPYEALPGDLLTRGANPMKRTWAEIDLSAIEWNFKTLQARLPAGSRCLGVVKADGYGHGAAPVALRLQALDCDYLAVACLDEGYALRKSGVLLPILVLGPTPADCAADLAALELTQAVGDGDYARALNAALCGAQLKVHAKLETGMGRTGFPADAAGAAALAACMSLPGLEFEGVFTHFAMADVPGDPYTGEQYARFRAAIAEAERLSGKKFSIVHCANSGATLHTPALHGEDMARPGVALYGLYPDGETEGVELHPVMRVRSRVAAITHHKAGDTIGYGRTYTCTRDCRIAVLPIGYADGLHRSLSGKLEVELCGVRCRQLGRICMDLCMVDVTDVPEVQVGTVATVLGGSIPAQELADKAGTIHYELVCAVSPRVPRVYFG